MIGEWRLWATRPQAAQEQARRSRTGFRFPGKEPRSCLQLAWQEQPNNNLTMAPARSHRALATGVAMRTTMPPTRPRGGRRGGHRPHRRTQKSETTQDSQVAHPAFPRGQSKPPRPSHSTRQPAVLASSPGTGPLLTAAPRSCPRETFVLQLRDGMIPGLDGSMAAHEVTARIPDSRVERRPGNPSSDRGGVSCRGREPAFCDRCAGGPTGLGSTGPAARVLDGDGPATPGRPW